MDGTLKRVLTSRALQAGEYFDEKTGEVRNTFWIYKKYLVKLSVLEKNGILAVVPSNIYAQESTIFITYPFESFNVVK